MAKAEIKQKQPNRKPSLRAKKAFDIMLENGGNKSQAMIAAGYSPASAKSPQKLTNSSGWEMLMDKHLNDKDLAKKHLELLNKQEVIVRNNVTTGELEVIPTGQLDVQAVKAALDMAYKLKGSYAPEKSIVANVHINEEKQQKSKSILRGIMRRTGGDS